MKARMLNQINRQIQQGIQEFDAPCDNQGRGRKPHANAIVETFDGRRLCKCCWQKAKNYK